MGRIIRKQVIASTGLDSHGESLSEEVIRDFFQQFSDPWPCFQNHDTSAPPVCRGLNKRLERLPDGNLAIVVDIKVLDEKRFAATSRNGETGFSIGFLRETYRFGNNPAVRILINPRQFDIDEMASEIRAILPKESFDVVERVEKADALTTAVIVLGFVGGAIATGFLHRVGSDLLDYLKKRRTKGTRTNVIIYLEIKENIEQHPVVVRLKIDSLVPSQEMGQIDLEAAVLDIKRKVRGIGVSHVVGVVLQGPVIKIRSLVKRDGSFVDIGDKIP